MDTATGWIEVLAAGAAGFLAGGPIGALGVAGLTYLMASRHNQTDANGNPIDSGLPWWAWILIGVGACLLLGLLWKVL